MARSIVRHTLPYKPQLSKTQAQQYWAAFKESAVFVYLATNRYGDFIPEWRMRIVGKRLIGLADEIELIAEFFCAYNTIAEDLRRCRYDCEEVEVPEVPFQLAEPKPFPDPIVKAVENYDPSTESSPDPGRVPRRRRGSV